MDRRQRASGGRAAICAEDPGIAEAGQAFEATGARVPPTTPSSSEAQAAVVRVLSEPAKAQLHRGLTEPGSAD
jgi:hypothetical protein